ncbi:MAG: 16S rRNA (adenine(1518)-N(6)/adenine(1519)-N(6))-dimethyltransferase RsmA [Proteobacteria bacterium]|nr:16S rRNA (adenine(1518)-N(6)/adenine(1519)-N(6))-dimethyltransferase RsmA [Pseudomonadota bacterium]
MNHRPRKRFGQHFLTSAETIEQIVAAIAPREGETIVEIGPGQAAITDPLAALASEMHAIEFDRDLAASLKTRFAGNERVSIHEADALKFDFSSLGDKLRIVGNLPYNISTPLLFHLLNYKSCIADAHFMLQKEVVDRMCASPGGKSFGRLTVMLGCRMEVVPLFDVPPTAFSPPPKVMSSVVRMRPIPDPGFDVHDPGVLALIVRSAFSRRRKTLRNALQGVAEVADIAAADIDPASRPEQVPISGWVALANHIAANQSSG